MTWGHRIAAAFRMDDATWARHANPWSVWTRVPMLAVLVGLAWSRVWLGAWVLPLLLMALAWLWWNPRAFPPPASTASWASHAVLGERVWLNRAAAPIPPHHARMALLLSLLPLPGLLAAIWGVVVLSPWPAVLGSALATLAKLWFCDRMAWLWRDMRHATPVYRSWSRP